MCNFLHSLAPSGAPQSVTSTVLNGTTVSIDWDPVDCNRTNGFIRGYILSFGIVDGVSSLKHIDSTQLNITLAGLRILTAYNFSVTAFTVKGIGPYSEFQEVVPSESEMN